MIDLDDPEKDRYLDLIKSYKECKINIKIYHDSLNTHAKRNNLLAQKSTGDIIFPANDDMLFVTENWDQLIDIEFSKNKIIINCWNVIDEKKTNSKVYKLGKYL